MESSNYDKRFFGIYRGVVVSTDDPLKRNRLKIKVPQVTGDAVTNWAWPCLSVAGVSNSFANGAYGSYQSFFDQSVAGANQQRAMTLSQIDAENGVHLEEASGDLFSGKSKIVFDQAGLYNIQWSGQFQNASTSSEEDVVVWIKLNGTDVLGSAGYIALPKTTANAVGHTVAAWNYLVNVNAGDYVQFYWKTTDTQVTLQYYAPGDIAGITNVPTTASLIVTIDPVSTPLSAAGNGVWVMYEGGDPNFPVWMGVF